MSGPAVSFSRRLDLPVQDCLASLERWAAGRSAVPSGPGAGAPPLRYRIAVRTGALRRTLLEVRLGPWAGTATTHLELVPSRPVRPTTRYLERCRRLLDELVAATRCPDPPGPKSGIDARAGHR